MQSSRIPRTNTPQKSGDERLAEISDQVRARLKKVCAHLPESEFAQLVHGIANNQRKWERLPQSFTGIVPSASVKNIDSQPPKNEPPQPKR